MPTALQLPFDHTPTVELSHRTYRKQVLPKGSITYRGRTITFDEAYLADLSRAFVDRAYDQVPFLLATDNNAHTMDPERFRGEVKAMETAPDGLYAIVEFASDEAAAAVTANPKLGVSARIIEGYERETDGQQFPHVIQHVLGTLDPRVAGMKPWEAVHLSSDPYDVVDLTAATISKEAPMAPKTDKLPDLSDEDRAKFDAYLAHLSALAPETGTKPDPAKPTTEGLSADEEAELAALLAQAEEEAQLEGAGVGTGGSDLSADARQAIELARAQSDQAAQETARIREELDLANFERETTALVGAGVPPVLVELATPLLLGAGHVVELSNATTVDAGEIVRKVLAECKGTIDMSRETLPATISPAGSATQALLDKWATQYGPR